MTYELLGDSIRCCKCRNRSFNPNDIKNLYCPCCNYFHKTELSETEVLFSDLWGNGFIYNIGNKSLSDDSKEFHQKVTTGEWIFLKLILNTDTVSNAKMKMWFELFDDYIGTHEIGAAGATAWFSQKKYSDEEIKAFKIFMDKVLIIKN